MLFLQDVFACMAGPLLHQQHVAVACYFVIEFDQSLVRIVTDYIHSITAHISLSCHMFHTSNSLCEPSKTDLYECRCLLLAGSQSLW